MTTDLTLCGAILPRDAGQHVYRTWHPVGADGVVCVTCDRSYGPAMADRATYRLHRWLKVRGTYAPQNGWIGCAKRGRLLTRQEAEQMLLDDTI